MKSIMFASNQILDVTCEPRDLAKAIAFGMSLHGDEMFKRADGRVKVAFSEPISGVYAIGTGSMEPVRNIPNGNKGHDCAKGWTDYPFDYDPAIIAGIITQWLAKQPEPPHAPTNGSEEIGVRMRSLDSMGDTLPLLWTLPNWCFHSCILLFTPARMAYFK